MKLIFSFLFSFFFSIFFAQKPEYAIATIPDSLKQNANAIVRHQHTEVKIHSQRSMNIKNQRVITVLNERGVEAIHAIEYYDKRTSVKNIMSPTVYEPLRNFFQNITNKVNEKIILKKI